MFDIQASEDGSLLDLQCMYRKHGPSLSVYRELCGEGKLPDILCICMYADDKDDSDDDSVDNNACEAVQIVWRQNIWKALNVLRFHFMYVMTYSQCWFALLCFALWGAWWDSIFIWFWTAWRLTSCAKILGIQFLETLLESIYFGNEETFALRIFSGLYAGRLINQFLIRDNICRKQWWQERKIRANNIWANIPAKPTWNTIKFQTLPVMSGHKVFQNLKFLLIYQWAIQDKTSLLVNPKALKFD